MDVFVHRNPTGCETFDLEDIKELEEQLKSFDVLEALNDKSEVHVEITGTWEEIRELLSQRFFEKVWFNPESPNAVGYHCGVCCALEWAPSDRLPKGWIEGEIESIKLPLCPNCQKK